MAAFTAAMLLVPLASIGRAHFGQEIKVTADDAAEDDWFGWSVGITEGAAIVGAVGNSDAGSLSGSAYLFIAEPASAALLAIELSPLCFRGRRSK